jgi:hypothetical protein
MEKGKNINKQNLNEQVAIEKVNRRKFIKTGLASAVMASSVLSLEENVLLAAGFGGGRGGGSTATYTGTTSKGKLGNLEINRLICGGNLINGYAHSRDLTYVSALLRDYFTDEKVMDLWEICEKNGITTCAILQGTSQAALIKRYRQERGGKMIWLSQTNPDEAGIESALKDGASAIYQVGTSSATPLSCATFIDNVRKMAPGMPIGLAGHDLDRFVMAEKYELPFDFYMKTFHSLNYWSSNVGGGQSRDNSWESDPDAVTEFFKSVKKPWIAYKVCAAGGLGPQAAFDYAFSHGADFVIVGMFSWQVAQDVQVAESMIEQYQTRERAWA